MTSMINNAKMGPANNQPDSSFILAHNERPLIAIKLGNEFTKSSRSFSADYLLLLHTA